MNRIASLSLLVLTGSLAVAASAQAQNLLSNPGFNISTYSQASTPNYAYGSDPSISGATPWTFSNNSGAGVAYIKNGSAAGFDVNGGKALGDSFAFIRSKGSNGSPAIGSISQSGLVVNTGGTLLLSFADASRVGNTQPVTFTATLSDGANTYVSAPFSVATTDTFATSDAYTFSGVAAGTYSLTFTGVTSTGTEAAYIDNVSLTEVPEPATWLAGALLGGVALLGGAKRFRRSSTVAA